jgi:hypothetical protein
MTTTTDFLRAQPVRSRKATDVTREAAEDRALALLASGLVQILSADQGHVAARVRGRHGVYDVAWYFGQWTCTCARHCLVVEVCKRLTRVDSATNPPRGSSYQRNVFGTPQSSFSPPEIL